MNLQEMRKQLNVTQDEFAQMLGIARATVNRWEQGRTQPSKMAQKLIEELFNPKTATGVSDKEKER